MKLKLVGTLYMGAMLLASANYAEAGSFDVPTTTYAKEALSATPGITAPNALYIMGVKRDFGKDFTIVFTLPEGVTFDGDPTLNYGGSSEEPILITRKRDGSGSRYVAFDVTMPTPAVVDVTTGSVVSVGDGFTLSNIALTGATRTVVCDGLSLSVGLWDFGESARIDNGVDLAHDLTACAQASNFVYDSVVRLPPPPPPPMTTLSAATRGMVRSYDDVNGVVLDTNLTTVDASASGAAVPEVIVLGLVALDAPPPATVPMAGFVPFYDSRHKYGEQDDLVNKAKATIEVKTHQDGVMTVDGNARYDLGMNNDKVTITITDLSGGGFQGLADDGLCFDLSDNGDCDAGEIFTILDNTATLDITVDDDGYGNATPVGLNRKRQIIFTSDGVTPMNPNQQFGIAGKVTPVADPTNVLSYEAPAGVWWDWDSNGVILQAPLAQSPAGWLCRTVLTNTGADAANFGVTILSETGITVTPNTTSGVIPANGTLVNSCSDFLSNITGGAPRVTFVFTVNAPSDNIQGLYQIVNGATGSISNHVMVRPGTN